MKIHILGSAAKTYIFLFLRCVSNLLGSRVPLMLLIPVMSYSFCICDAAYHCKMIDIGCCKCHGSSCSPSRCGCVCFLLPLPLLLAVAPPHYYHYHDYDHLILRLLCRRTVARIKVKKLRRVHVLLLLFLLRRRRRRRPIAAMPL